METKVGKIEQFAKTTGEIIKTKTFRFFQCLLALVLFALQAIRPNGSEFYTQLSYLLIIIFFFPIFSAVLVTVDDISHALFSFMVLSINFMLKKDFEAKELLVFLPFLIMIVVALIAKPVIFRKKFKAGELVIGYLAVLFVSIFSGISNSATEAKYSSGALYIYFGVGIGAIFAYLYCYNFLNRSHNDEAVKIVPKAIILVGLLTFFIIITQEYSSYHTFISKLAQNNGVSYYEVYKLYTIDYILRNMNLNIYGEHELLLLTIMALPIFFYKATTTTKYGIFYFSFGILSLGLIIFVTTISLAVYVTLLTVFLCAILAITYTVSKKRYAYIGILIGAILLSLLAITIFSDYTSLYIERLQFKPSDATIKVYKEGIQKFLEYPFLGAGIGHTLDGEVASNITGIMMYQSSIIQIIVSFGALGLIAYAFLFVRQFNMIRRRHRKINLFFFISFVAYFLVNLVKNTMFLVLPFIIFDAFKMAFMERSNKIHISGERLLYYSLTNQQSKESQQEY